MLTQPTRECEEADLFAAALALPLSERDDYLKRACSSNPALLERLKGLLDAVGGASAFITESAAVADVGSHIGPYQVLQELGEGGCGVAYLADQTSPVKRQVALKVIKPGMDTKAVIARFEAERQALALLDHPNIAKVFDAGTTMQGRPYFVMELVRGIKITEFCAHRRMAIHERLSLFVQVCQAILHAHQKGIIHRDVKPSNVLVTMHDGLPTAKVIDFGIAKAIHGRLIDQTLQTEINQIMGTPAYLSPEQARSTHAAVDTRSDIYGLGVLLYELLTGYTPFDARELAEANPERLRERICTEEPERPSRRLNALSQELLAKAATNSSTTATRLIKQVRDDLDWIVMQCLRKEPSQRYQAVNELIADIQRYLRHEPIAARPPSLIYSVRRSARRNRVAFAAALIGVMFLILISAFAITMTIQADRIAAERDRAEQEKLQAHKVANIALSVLAIADPFKNLANEVSAHAVLDRAARSIERELQDDPFPRARLLQAVGVAYIRRSEFKPAVDHLRHSVQILSQMPGSESDTMRAMIDLSLALRMSGDFRGARQALADGEDIAKRFGAQRTPSYARLLLNRGRVHVEESRIAEARMDFERSLRLYRETVGSRSIEVAEVLSELSTVLQWTDEHVLAEQIARESIDIFDHTAPSMYPDRVQTEVRLAEALYLQDRLDEATSILAEGLQKSIQLFGENSVEVADVLDKLAMVSYAQRRLDEAERYSRDAVATAQVAYGYRHTLTASMATTLGRTLAERRKYLAAETTLREALDIFGETVPADHQYVASTEYLLGEVLIATNRFAEASTVLTDSMNRWKRSGAPPWRAARSASALGEALYRQGRTREGTEYLSQSFHELTADSSADGPAKEKARARFERYVRKPSRPMSAVIPEEIAAQ